MRIVSFALGVAALAFAGCGQQQVVGRGDYVIRGSLVDAETNEPVSREQVYVHLFNDVLGVQTSVEREDVATFTVRMPRPDVRMLVVDSSGRYELYETNVDVPVAGLEQVVRLVPTHYVLVKGRLLVRKGAGWAPVPLPEGEDGIGGWPLLSFVLEHGSDMWPADLQADGSFEVRVPRERLSVVVLETELSPQAPILDLTGFAGDSVERDIHLVREP